MNLFPKVLATFFVATATVLSLSQSDRAQEIREFDDRSPNSSQTNENSPSDGDFVLTGISLQGIEAKNSEDWLWTTNSTANEKVDLNLSQPSFLEGIIIDAGSTPNDEFFHDDRELGGSGKIILWQN